MLFSIIIPVYKAEAYLKPCIDSILSQSFKDYELILVDDGSPDNCPDICDKYAEQDRRIVVIHKENGGASSARNVALRAARGEYLIYLDSDDFLISSDCLQAIAEVTGGNADIIMYKTAGSDETGKNITYPHMDMNISSNNHKVSEMLAKAVAGETFQTSAWSKAIRRSFLVDSGIEFKEKLVGEDIDWYLGVVRQVKTFELLDKYIYVYRRRPGSVTKTTGIKNLKDLIWILQKWDDILCDNPTDEALRHYLGKTYAGLLIMYAGIKDSEKKKYKKEIKSMSHMLKYDAYPRTNKIKTAYSILGFNMTVFLLKIARYIKSKI